ncbi:MAG: hypothetical protein JO314_10325 [Acidobacteria bacterium]|nr:hypothetical protein [Acidobacteriota bacterium]
MKWFHLAIGLLLFVAFCVTGRMMRVDFPDKEIIPQDLRLLMRSRHIYILFNSLIWLMLGVYFRLSTRKWQIALQGMGSLLLLLAAAHLVWGWYLETYEIAHFSDVSRWGIYLSLGGVGFHLIGGLRLKSDSV